MTSPVRALVPMAHVASVARSVAFYRLLGFEVDDAFTPPGQAEPTWASLVSGRAMLMVTKADAPLGPGLQGVLFYAYCDDVAAAREALAAQGVEAGEIRFPFYAPRGEFRIEDPDGYVIMVTHT